MEPLTKEELKRLAAAMATRIQPLCPKCGKHRQDPLSVEGWCTHCTSARHRSLAQKRHSWEKAQRRRKEASGEQA